MEYKHGGLSHQQKQYYLRVARRVDPSPSLTSKSSGQPTLYKFVQTQSIDPREDHRSDDDDVQMPRSDQPTAATAATPVVEQDLEGTRHFPKYNVDDPVFFRFQNYLTGIDGGMRCSKSACEIAVDVSKFLRYANCTSANWSRLTDRDQLTGYFEKLKRCKVGPEGQLSKIHALCAGLRFLKVHIICDDRHPLHSQVTQMELILTGWKQTLRKGKRKPVKSRLQKLSSESLSLDETSALLDCQAIWAHFNQTCLEAQRDEAVAGIRLDHCTVALAGSVLYKNWQRPGAVANASVKEFEEAKVIRQGGELMHLMYVEHHKTSLEGAAKVILEPVDHSRIVLYLSTVRPLQESSMTANHHLFLLTGGRVLTNLSTRIKKLGEKYKLSLPCASRVRKIGATSVAMNSLTLLQKRRAFTERETNSIADHFAANIRECTPAPLMACKSFLMAHPIQRSPKNVQDKVKSLIKAKLQ